MYCYKQISPDLYWIGGSDRRLALFENVYPLTNGVAYNSYVLLDEKSWFSTRWTKKFPRDISTISPLF